MTRKHGIVSDTLDKLILDSGAVYTNFVSLTEPGALIGATRGGAIFKRNPVYKELKYEGVPGQVAGQKHLVDVKVTLDVNIISFDETNLRLAIPNSAIEASETGYTGITEGEWDSEAVHSLTNIAIIAELSDGDPIAIILDNPICESDLGLGFKDKNETVSKWVFSAFYKESEGFDSAPWRILWPGVVVITDIVETGLAATDYAETGIATTNIVESGV